MAISHFVKWYLAVAFTLSLPGIVAQARPGTEPIGIVNGVKGIWTRPQDGKVLTRGELIFSGQTVTTEQSTAASIGIVLFTTGKIWEQHCTVSTPCETSFRPPQPADHATGVWAYVKSYLRPDTAIPAVFAGSRSIGQDEPHFALLPVSHEQIDLTPALATVGPGSYNLLLTPASAQDANESNPRPALPISWKGTSFVMAAPPSGLYALQLLRGPDLVGDPAAVLIVREDAEHDKEIWRAINNEVREWTGVNPGVIDDMLLSILCALPAR